MATSQTPWDGRGTGSSLSPGDGRFEHRSGTDKSTVLTRGISDIIGWLGSFPAIVIAALLVLAWAVVGVVTAQLSNNTYQLIITRRESTSLEPSPMTGKPKAVDGGQQPANRNLTT